LTNKINDIDNKENEIFGESRIQVIKAIEKTFQVKKYLRFDLYE
jgi:hypothetical protein